MIMIRTLRRDIARYNKEDEMVSIVVRLVLMSILQLAVKTSVGCGTDYQVRGLLDLTDCQSVAIYETKIQC